MQIRCTHCTKTVALGSGGELPAACPHCARAPGPGALGPYEPVRLIAAGGMGEVYLARHRELGTEVALKVLPAMPLDAIAGVRERFAREARLTAKVQHPGVVKVHGCDVAGDRPYLVLEFVDGETLRQRLQRGALPVVDAARLVADTADVLAAAHAQGVLHRDVKPDNVMVLPHGDVRVLDFGIARGLQDDAPLTRTGEIVGTPEYMAPEQLLDGPDAITERTDVHALGVLLFELLTGRSPFHGANVFQALKLVESLVPPRPSTLRSDVPQALDDVVGRALAKQPGERWPSARAFAEALRQAVPAARVATPSKTTSPWVWVGLAAASLVLVGGIAFVLMMQSLARGLNQLPAALASKAGTIVSELFDVVTVELWLHGGHWQRTLASAESSATSDSPLPFAARQNAARTAFACTQVGWPLAAGAPTWLAATAERQRTRWFGDGLEPGTDVDNEAAGWRRVLAGVGEAAGGPPSSELTRHERRLHLLARHLATDDAAVLMALHTDGNLVDDALSRLLRIRLRPLAERADAFGSYARRLPLDSPEHWLARTIERHLRSDPEGASQAAEMAWLSGAGELAVLLDAWLQLAPAPSQGTLQPLPPPRYERLRARVAAGDAKDAPAGVVMLALLDAVHGRAPDARPLRGLPDSLRAMARRWFVATATSAAEPLRLQLLLLATALGAAPDYTQTPWREVAEDSRAVLDAEAQRGR